MRAERHAISEVGRVLTDMAAGGLKYSAGGAVSSKGREGELRDKTGISIEGKGKCCLECCCGRWNLGRIFPKTSSRSNNLYQLQSSKLRGLSGVWQQFILGKPQGRQ